MKRFLFLPLAVLAATLSLAADLHAELKVGDPAPEFELMGSDGKTYRLSQFKGKQPVVLAWYPKAFTGGWTRECKSLRESGAEISKLNVAFFAASCDSVARNTDFAKSLDLNYPILSDPDKDVARAYGVVNETRAVPFRWTFFIDIEGKIQFVDKEVQAGSHGEDVLKRLKSLKQP